MSRSKGCVKRFIESRLLSAERDGGGNDKPTARRVRRTGGGGAKEKSLNTEVPMFISDERGWKGPGDIHRERTGKCSTEENSEKRK